MRGCEKHGIIRKNGFLYLEGRKYKLRVPADKEYRRDIKYIAIEEIAAGMMVFIKHNISVDRDGLYKTLASELGFARVADNITARFDEAVKFLVNKGYVVEEDGTLMLNNK